MFEGLSQEDLAAALIQAPAVELEAITLLRENPPRPGNLFPTGLPRETYTRATIQMVKYARECADLAARVRDLPGVPLKVSDDALIGGFSL
jgi:hypothetical protein